MPAGRTSRSAAVLIGAGGLVTAMQLVRHTGGAVRPFRSAFMAVSKVAPSVAPAIQKTYWRRFYGYWGQRGYGFYGEGSDRKFMNYGYAALDGQDGTEAARGLGAGFGAALYERVGGAVDLAGKDVLEVGCGRGAGAAHVFETFGPASMTGIDLATKSIAGANAQYGRPGLMFREGDAEDLPFADASFDTVLNVESSHCYPHFDQFLAEVHRVLRPGGHLSFADIRFAERRSDREGGVLEIGYDDDLVTAFEASPFEIVEQEDITPNVLHALELDTPRRREQIERAPRLLQPLFAEFAGIEGSKLHRDYGSGAMRYLRFVLRKAG
jgi:SAM-dependent methyltransferase